MGKDMEIILAICHTAFVGLGLVNKNSPSCE